MGFCRDSRSAGINMSVVAAAEESVGVKKQLAVLQGEVDGLACKLNGYERALQDC